MKIYEGNHGIFFLQRKMPTTTLFNFEIDIPLKPVLSFKVYKKLAVY